MHAKSFFVKHWQLISFIIKKKEKLLPRIEVASLI